MRLKQQGFTLIELSIVLVIIGLLIAGILAAQALIESGKVYAEVKQLQQVDIAVTNFQNKYKYMPGDSPLHSDPGDGDGKLENSIMNSSSTISSDGAFDYETGNFWPHLHQDGFYANEYPAFSNVAASGLRVGINMPEAKFGDKNTGIVPFSQTNIVIAPFYFFANFEGLTTSVHTPSIPNMRGSIPVSQAVSLDSKIDDGIPRQPIINSYAGKMYISSATASCYDTTTTPYRYNLGSGAKCMVFISIKQHTPYQQ